MYIIKGISGLFVIALGFGLCSGAVESGDNSLMAVILIVLALVAYGWGFSLVARAGDK